MAIRARTATSSTRPLPRLDVADFDPTGASLESILAPEPDIWNASVEAADASEVSSRAAIQVAALRTLLEEAARLDKAAAARTRELAQRLEQGASFEREMDRRLEAAGRAGQVLDQASAVLSGLENVIAQLSGARDNAAARAERQLESMQLRLQQQLAEAEARAAASIEQHVRSLETTLAQHAEAIGTRLMEVSDQASRALDGARISADAAETEVRRVSANIERNARAEADRIEATLERHGAAVQARVCIMLDEAAQRLADLERLSARVGATSSERLEKLCERAAAVLGYDPRHAWMEDSAKSPARDSLADVAARAESAAENAAQAIIRLGIAGDRASEIEAKITDAVRRAGELKAAEELIAQTAAAEERLGVLRDDLESTATSVRFNLSQAQEAELILGKTIDRARDKVHSLDRAMDQVTDQAQGLVSVARDVAGLVVKAEQTRAALAGAIAEVQQADAQVPPLPAGRVSAESGENAAAAA